MRELSEIATSPPEQSEVRSVLAIKPFRRLWISLSLSSLGDWLGFLATTALATELTTSYSHKLYAVAGVLFVRLLPAVVIGPVAGAFADRFNRRTTMVFTDVLRFGLVLSIPLFPHLWWLLVASFLVECNSLFWIPAKEASIPNLVPRHLLESANQLNLVTTYGFGAVAALVFSALAFLNRALAHDVSFFRTNPVNLALYIDALTFLISALTIVNLTQIAGPRPNGTAALESGDQVGLFTSITEGLRFVGGQRWLKGLVIGVCGATGAGAAVIGLSQRFASDLNGGNAAYGTLFGTVFVGLAAGMFLGPRLAGGFSRRRLVGLGIIACGLTLAIESVVPNLALAILTTAVMGFWAGLVWVVALTLVGSEVSDELRGRTFAFIYNLMRIVLLTMVVAAPAVAGAIGPHELTVADSQVRLDGITLTLFGFGVLAMVLGSICYRLMDDRPDVSLWADLTAAARRNRPQLGRGTTAGLFIAFEGGEGAGKSTQVRRLAGVVRALGHEVVVTFEPGATAIGARLRDVLLDRENAQITALAEALLYAADRAQHVATVIRPAIERGAVVITDRYVDSTVAYQSGGRGLPERDIRRISALATGGLRPDLTILLDVPPSLGLQRLTGPGDRIETEEIEFHQRVRRSFRSLANQRRGRYLVIDATASVDHIHEVVVARALQLILSADLADDASARSLAKATS
ncbi:MAG TPA: dTMP kinase [Mycobacteriales bacterium]|nr:dTMP kinase [Mycobacteriales bacterium]